MAGDRRNRLPSLFLSCHLAGKSPPRNGTSSDHHKLVWGLRECCRVYSGQGQWHFHSRSGAVLELQADLLILVQLSHVTEKEAETWSDSKTMGSQEMDFPVQNFSKLRLHPKLTLISTYPNHYLLSGNLLVECRGKQTMGLRCDFTLLIQCLSLTPSPLVRFQLLSILGALRSAFLSPQEQGISLPSQPPN